MKTPLPLLTLFLLLLFSHRQSASGAEPVRAVRATSSLAQREIARRMQRVEDARTLITKGDELLGKKDCEGALNSYREAIKLLPDAPATQQIRDEVAIKHSRAAVCLAEERAKNGRYEDARTLLHDALAQNPEAKEASILLESLADPDRYNPSLTPAHVERVNDVELALQKGWGYYNLGDLDRANESFKDALRLDPYNTAARRGMESTEQQRAEYFDTAREQLRIKMLNEVNRGWEDPVPEKMLSGTAPGFNTAVNPGAYYTEKMARIVFPVVQFSGASIEEAVEFLRIKSREYDTIEKDSTKRGVNLIIRPGTLSSSATISLDLKDVPMSEALRYVTELGGMKYKVEPFAVVVVPISDVSTEMYTRTFKVPPDFLASGAQGGGAAPAAPADPFAPAGANAAAGALPARPTALDILKAQGIPFPEGTSAVFITSTSQLIVRNTAPSLDLVEQYVEEINKRIPQQVYITAKFVEVSQKNTDELGFDWTLGAFGIGNNVFGSGGTTGNSSNGSLSTTDYPFTLDGTVIGSNQVTAGNRSGSAAITQDSIDGLISAQNLASSVAPGIFALAGVYTDPQFQVVVRALSQKKGVDLMSAPSVTTRSGQRASIEVIREFIYPTEFEPPQIPQTVGATSTTGGTGTASASSFPVTPTTPTAFEMRPVGVRMEVDPVIGPDGYTIDLSLSPEVTEFEGFINYGSPINSSSVDALGNPVTITLTENRIEQPVFSSRKVTTAVTVWDGQTVAMGGLIREDVQDVEDKVPILGDIPILGRLFQSKAEDHFKRNLMIFVTANIIDPSGERIRKPAVRQESLESTPLTSPTSLNGTTGAGVGVDTLPLPAILPQNR